MAGSARGGKLRRSVTMGKVTRYGNVVVHTPQNELLMRLIPIVEGLEKRGAVSYAIKQRSNDLEEQDEICFIISAVFGLGNSLKVSRAHFVCSLIQHGFEVQRTFSTDIGERDIHLTAVMKV